ncbi:hypothetical protein G5I_06289 [Acromyrmex echinatior]|uniref:Uncharacterized protein n=1 Tax=Acromyrmex echinatior TaxID=103372 RepID=F4WKM0_ACREC|nr:hypothetical protein G5I_06289 [Acromyrmex echinatior]
MGYVKSTQGIKISVFPKDPNRRMQWIAAVQALDKPNWNLTKDSVLCEGKRYYPRRMMEQDLWRADRWRRQRETKKKEKERGESL